MPKNIAFYLFLALAFFSAIYFAFSQYLNDKMGIPDDVAGPLERVAIFVCLAIPLSILFWLLRTWNNNPSIKK